MADVTFTKELQKVQDQSDHTYVFGAALVPGEKDSQNHIISKEEIEKTAHKFMERYQNVGLSHKSIVDPDSAVFVESFIAKHDDQVDGYPEGTWFLGTKIYDEEIRSQVLSGELAAYSIGGHGILTEVE